MTEPPNITFTKGSKSPAAAPAVAAGTPPPISDPVPTPPSTPSQTRPAAGQFRCPACQVMVTPDAAGKCPRCGATPPHAVQMPREGAPIPARAAVAKAPAWMLWSLLLATFLGAGALVVRCARGAFDPRRGASVSGETSVRHLGVKAIFPPGWRRVSGTSARLALGNDLDARTARFFRGGRAASPDVSLVLGLADGRLTPPESGQIIPDTQFLEAVQETAGAIVWALGGSVDMDPAEDCALTQVGLRRTGRCAGYADVGGPRAIAIYVWEAEGRTAVAVLLGKGDMEALVDEGDDIVATVEVTLPPRRPAEVDDGENDDESDAGIDAGPDGGDLPDAAAD